MTTENYNYLTQDMGLKLNFMLNARG